MDPHLASVVFPPSQSSIPSGSPASLGSYCWSRSQSRSVTWSVGWLKMLVASCNVISSHGMSRLHTSQAPPVVSPRVASGRVISCQVMVCHVLSSLPASCHSIMNHNVSCHDSLRHTHVLSCRVVKCCDVLSCHTLYQHAMSCHVASLHIISGSFFSRRPSGKSAAPPTRITESPSVCPKSRACHVKRPSDPRTPELLTVRCGA